MAYNIKNRKPKLSTGETVSSDGHRQKLSFDNHVTIFIQTGSGLGGYIIGWVMAFLRAILISVALLTVLYTGIGGTLLFYTSTGDGFYNSMVARNTFVGGIPTADSIVLTSRTTPAPESSDLITKGIQAWTGIDTPVVGRIIASTGETVIIVDGRLQHSNGEIIPYGWASDAIVPEENADSPTIVHLSDENIVLCLEGECETGKLIFVPQTHIYGEVKNYVDGGRQ